jgi:O-antigen/teichoic acid export membrane protein
MTIFSGSVITFLIRIFGMLALVCSYSLVSKNYTTSEFAEFSLIISILIITGVFSKFGFDQILIRELAKIDRALVYNHLFNAFLLSFSLTIIITLIVYLIYKDVVTTTAVFFFCFYSFLPEYYRALGNPIVYAIYRNLVFNFLLLVFLLLGFYFPQLSLKISIFFAVIFAMLFNLFLLLSKFNEKQQFCFKKSIFIEIFKYAVPIFILQLGIVLQSYGFVLYLDLFGTDDDVAVYSIFINGVLVFSMFSTSVGIFVAKDLAKYVATKKVSQIRKMYFECCKTTALILLPAFVTIIIFSELIFNFLFEKSVVEYLLHFYIMCFAAFLSAILGPKFTMLNMLNNHMFLLKVSIIIQVLVFFVAFIFSSYSSIIHVVSTLYAVSILAVSLICFIRVFKLLVGKKNVY